MDAPPSEDHAPHVVPSPVAVNVACPGPRAATCRPSSSATSAGPDVAASPGTAAQADHVPVAVSRCRVRIVPSAARAATSSRPALSEAAAGLSSTTSAAASAGKARASSRDRRGKARRMADGYPQDRRSRGVSAASPEGIPASGKRRDLRGSRMLRRALVLAMVVTGLLAAPAVAAQPVIYNGVYGYAHSSSTASPPG